MLLVYTLDITAFHYVHPSTSLRMHPDVHGFSHDLRNSPPDCFLPSLWSGRSFESRSSLKILIPRMGYEDFWRRVRDSNPRFLSESPVFKTGSLNRSDNSPCVRNYITFQYDCQEMKKRCTLVHLFGGRGGT